MKKVNWTALVAMGALLLVAFLWNRPSQHADGQPPGKAQQWEHKVLYLDQILDKDGEKGTQAEVADRLASSFNKLGQDGWEYCGQVFLRYWVFKRAKR